MDASRVMDLMIALCAVNVEEDVSEARKANKAKGHETKQFAWECEFCESTLLNREMGGFLVEMHWEECPLCVPYVNRGPKPKEGVLR